MNERPKVTGPVTDTTGNGNVVLRGRLNALTTDLAREFIIDCARHTERQVSDNDIKNKYDLTDEHWQALTHNAPLLEAVRAERERRLLGGAAGREGARREFAKVPTVLGTILTDDTISPRHRIEAARELRQAAAVGDTPDAGPENKFHIYINIGDGRPIDQVVTVPPRLDVLEPEDER